MVLCDWFLSLGRIFLRVILFVNTGMTKIMTAGVGEKDSDPAVKKPSRKGK